MKHQEEEELETRRSENIFPNDNSSCDRNHNNSSVQQTSQSLPFVRKNLYVCVYCGTPCAALYRQLNKNSLSSIKALRCENCHRILDPYVQREWLLVIIDCILLRPEAYRHVLYNNQDLSCYIHAQQIEEGDQKQGNRNLVAAAATSTTLRIQRLVQLTLLSSLFHAYLKWQAFVDTRQKYYIMEGHKMPSTVFSNGDSSTLLNATFIVTSALDLVVQWLTVYGFMKLLSIQSESVRANNLDSTANRKGDDNNQEQVPDRLQSVSPSHNSANQVFLALLLPTSFRIISVLVLLWENTKTTRAFGSLLVACWQCLGISLIATTSHSKSGAKSSFQKIFTPLVGIVSLVAWRFGVDRFLFTMITYTTSSVKFLNLYHTIPCVGYEFDVLDNIVNLINNEDLSGGAGWASPPLLLCIT